MRRMIDVLCYLFNRGIVIQKRNGLVIRNARGGIEPAVRANLTKGWYEAWPLHRTPEGKPPQAVMDRRRGKLYGPIRYYTSFSVTNLDGTEVLAKVRWSWSTTKIERLLRRLGLAGPQVKVSDKLIERLVRDA